MRTEATAVRTHTVVGVPDEVRAALARAAADGRLAGIGAPVELPGHRVQVTAALHEPAEARSTVWRWLRPALVALAAALLVGGLVWGLVLLATALVAALTTFGAWLSTQLPLIVAVAIGLAVLAIPAGARCVGVHCGGCRR